MRLSSPLQSKLLVAVLAITLPFGMVGCSAYTVATHASAVIGAILQVAAAEEVVVPVADQAAYTSFVNLGQSLNTQLNSCIASANSGLTKSGKFLACFNGFAQGLSSPAELAQLRLLSAGTQSKVQLYIVGIVTGVNVAIAAFGGTQATAPTVSEAMPTPNQLQELAAQAHVDSRLIVLAQ